MGLLTSLRVRMEWVRLCLGDMRRQWRVVLRGFHGGLQVGAWAVFGGLGWLALSLAAWNLGSVLPGGRSVVVAGDRLELGHAWLGSVLSGAMVAERVRSHAWRDPTPGIFFDISFAHFIRYIEMTAPRDLDGPARPLTSRPLSRGDLRLLVLSLLAAQPRHGYELIQCISEMFVRVYTPSAGSIYPVLAQFEAAGWVSALEEAGRKRYQLTALGQAELAAQREEVDAALHRVRHSARAIAKANLPPVVRDAMRELKQALGLHHARWQDDNAVAVAQALREAAAQIRAQGR